MDPRLEESQKRQDATAAFWPRRLSPYVTRVALKTSITPNQMTVLWAAISVANSYTVYRALCGDYWLVPLIPLVYVFCYVLDCVDGEIARYRNIANPVGGKLLDGISHRATEYSLLAAFLLAAQVHAESLYVLAIGIALLTGDAMYSYAYERRLTTLRAQGFTGQVKRTAAGTYQRGTPWSTLSRQQKLGTIVGQLHYKSIYPVIAVAYLSSTAFVVGLGVLAVYKHWKWVRLIQGTVAATAIAGGQAQPAGSTAAATDPVAGRG